MKGAGALWDSNREAPVLNLTAQRLPPVDPIASISLPQISYKLLRLVELAPFFTANVQRMNTILQMSQVKFVQMLVLGHGMLQ